MLMANPDPVAVEKWARFMYSNISYMVSMSYLLASPVLVAILMKIFYRHP